MIQTEVTLYRNAQTALQGSTDGAAWAWPGVAFTAGTAVFYFKPEYVIHFARWVTAWNPNTMGSPTGVQLVHADSGPEHTQAIAECLRSDRTRPLVDGINITNVMQALCLAGVQKTLAIRTAGNGVNGCLIYSSVIEIIWA